jgi:hypothetical protein
MDATIGKLVRGAAVLGFAAVASGPASANYLTYFGEDINHSPTVPLATHLNADTAQNSFLGGLIGVGTETFEGIATNTPSPLALNFGAAGTATLSGGSGVVSHTNVGTTNGAGRYAISGTQFWEVSAGGGGNFHVDFSNSGGIAAFGFYGVDIGDFGGTLTLTLANGLSTVLNVPNTVGSNGSTDGSVLYFGVIGTTAADRFTSVTFNTSTGQGDVFAFDNLTIGSLEQVHVPEPGTLALIGIGLAGLWFRRRSQA